MKKNRKLNKSKIKKISIFFMIVLLIIMVAIFIINKNKSIELTQLGNQTEKQMMGYVIKTKNNKIIVIDGGNAEDSQNLVNYLEKYNKKVDYWFITHVHDDHAGAFIQIVNNEEVNISNVIASTNDYEWYETYEPGRKEFSKKFLNTLQNNAKIKNKVHQAKLNEKINIDGIKAEILGIKNPEITENSGNEQSLVIKFNTGKTTFLVLGDTGVNLSKKLLDTQKEKLKSDIVQMSHHGQNGATKELYSQIQPQICMWPTPEWLWKNDSGTGEDSGTWKTKVTRKWMEELNVKENYVEKDGNITIKIK